VHAADHRPIQARGTAMTATGKASATGKLPTRLSLALAGVSTIGATLTLALPDVLNGTAAMNGSARGTAAVLLAAGVPALLGVMLAARTLGPARTSVLWLGVLGYFAYNSLLFLFATPFNELFLLYVAMMSLSLAALIAFCRGVDVVALDGHLPRRTARGLAAFLGLITAGNAAIWLSAVVPALADANSPGLLEGTGLTTNPIYVQDLSFWLPLAAMSTVWLWQRRPWGVLLGGGFLSMWVLEGLTVATDQWFGSEADPGSSVVSSSMVVPFLVLAAITAVATLSLLRGLRQPADSTKTTNAAQPAQPGPARNP
jgi:hypothetical protein